MDVKESNMDKKKDITLDEYKRNKIKMLKRQFCVRLTEEQEEHINSLKSEIAVDTYARSLM